MQPHEPQHARTPCPSPTPIHPHHQLPPKPMSIVLVMPSNHLILGHPLLVLPSIFPRIRVFSTRIPLLLAAHGVFHLPCSMQSLQLQHVLSSYLCVCMCAQSFQLFPTLCDPIDCSSLTRDQTWTPELVVWSVSHWTTRQFLDSSLISRSLINRSLLHSLPQHSAEISPGMVVHNLYLVQSKSKLSNGF